ncbi:MAG: sigma-70 family RNA polymerase sigma factor [Chitinophagaceae bacterium]|nr:sigma-70 family RNA polymerase sigma factor [Chitinophagaceae bacterium]
MATHPSNENKELLLRIAEGDEQAFATLYRSYVPRLEPFISSITKSDSLVKEVIQETFTRLWMNRERLSEVEYPHTYILRTASYVCFTYLRRVSKDQRIVAALGSTFTNDNLTEETVLLKDLERTIREALTELTPSQLRIYRLSREEGLKIPEIAERLGISANTVKNTLVASLKAIREYAKKAGYSLSLLFLWIFI